VSVAVFSEIFQQLICRAAGRTAAGCHECCGPSAESAGVGGIFETPLYEVCELLAVFHNVRGVGCP
jgi:hypothetical protein